MVLPKDFYLILYFPQDYVAQRNYQLLTVPEYGKVLESAGFQEVEAVDNTKYFLEILRAEIRAFRPKKDDRMFQFSSAQFQYTQCFLQVIAEFGSEKFETICTGWEDKIVRCESGDQVWGYFFARKMFG